MMSPYRRDPSHSQRQPHLRLDMLQLRPAQRFPHAGGVVPPAALPSPLPQPPKLQPVPGLAGLRRRLAALRVEHGSAAGGARFAWSHSKHWKVSRSMKAILEVLNPYDYYI